jgi:hypothetical protein
MRSWPVLADSCGIILLLNAAIFFLRMFCSPVGLFAPVEKAPEFQKIVHAKR